MFDRISYFLQRVFAWFADMSIRYRHRMIVSTSAVEGDRIRRDVVLYVLLRVTIGFVVCGLFVSFGKLLFADPVAYRNNALSISFIFLLFVFLCSLFVMARCGYALRASYLLLLVYYVLANVMAAKWGVDLPAALLFQVLTITFAGILINSRFAVLTTGIVSMTLMAINALQNQGILVVNSAWRMQPWGWSDILMSSLIFLMIAGVCWLYNRQIEQALGRAQSSERALIHERDHLEEVVEERTRDLRAIQMKQMEHLYRSAEFGRLSSGLFHDLINFLTSLSLTVERACLERTEVAHAQSHLDRAVSISKRLNYFVDGIRKQLSYQTASNEFCINHEIEQIIELLSYRIRQSGARIDLSFHKKVIAFGQPVKFAHVISNLLLNALDAYTDSDPLKVDRRVLIELDARDGLMLLRITDWGCGIAREVQTKIFEPFFTTKKPEQGMGIGLSLSRHIIEKDFFGTITVTSELGRFTQFLIQFPHA